MTHFALSCFEGSKWAKWERWNYISLSEGWSCQQVASISSEIMKQIFLKLSYWLVHIYLGDSGRKSWSSVSNAQFYSELSRVCYRWHHQEIAYTNWICPSNANKVSQWFEPTHKCLISWCGNIHELWLDMLELTSCDKVLLEHLVVTHLVKESLPFIEPKYVYCQ